MAAIALHTQESTKAKALCPLRDGTIGETEQAERWASDVMSRAFGSVPTSRLAKLADISETRVRHFRTAGMAFLRMMRSWAVRYPDAVRTVGQALIDLATPTEHQARPLPERVLSCMAEFGDLSREIHLALADGTVDAGERGRILTELGHARAELDRLERDLG